MNSDDYKYSLYSPSPNYGSAPNFIDTTSRVDTGFTSLYRVTKETAEAITTAQSAKGFKGIVWNELLWLDVDSYEEAEKVELKLKEMGYAFTSYDTGGRGAHFAIKRDINPSHLVPLQDKTWQQEHFPNCDSSIYTHLHPFRLPGTIHAKTGRRKIKVEEHLGRTLTLPAYTEKRIEVAGETEFRSEATKSIFDIHFIQRNSEAAKAGERHPQLVRLCYALRDNGYDINIARWWVSEVNKRFLPPKTNEEIEKVLGSIYR